LTDPGLAAECVYFFSVLSIEELQEVFDDYRGSTDPMTMVVTILNKFFWGDEEDKTPAESQPHSHPSINMDVDSLAARYDPTNKDRRYLWWMTVKNEKKRWAQPPDVEVMKMWWTKIPTVGFRTLLSENPDWYNYEISATNQKDLRRARAADAIAFFTGVGEASDYLALFSDTNLNKYKQAHPGVLIRENFLGVLVEELNRRKDAPLAALQQARQQQVTPPVDDDKEPEPPLDEEPEPVVKSEPVVKFEFPPPAAVDATPSLDFVLFLVLLCT
jgi:hypothetical protein